MPLDIQRDSYYYEVNSQGVLLLHCIPRHTLITMIDNGDISARALVDYPDGIDMECSEGGFEEFTRLYDYKPRHNPNDLMEAFKKAPRTRKSTGEIPGAKLETFLP